MEGVMMRGVSSMAISVRDEKGAIRTETKRVTPQAKKNLFFRLPIVRGIISFFSSLIMGITVLMRSAEVFGEGEPTKFDKWLAEKLKVNVMGVVTTLSLVLGLALAVFLFIWLPVNLRAWVFGDVSVWAKNFIEGGIKILVFVLYIVFVSLIKDVKRTFMYHGAEHKTITCYEKGLPLTVENAKSCKRVHDRCGTTFIVFVLTVSIIVFALFESVLSVNGVILPNYLRVLCKLALLPLVAGVSYELLKALAKTDSPIVYPIKAPGFLLQLLTTKEPTDDMLEVAITSFVTVMEMDADQTIKTRGFFENVSRKELTEKVYKKLSENGITERAEAEWIVSLTLKISRSETRGNEIVSFSDEYKVNKLVAERLTGRPLWYCIGDVDFCGVKIKTDERALIPRPETELLCNTALSCLSETKTVLDLCTGSGAIAIRIAKNPSVKVFASDIDKKALSLAKENAEINNVSVTFIESDLFDAFNNLNLKFDVIVSNPPYVKSGDIKSLQNEVKNFEPRIALDGGEDGLSFYRRIAEKSALFLKDGGAILLEVGIDQAGEVCKMFADYKKVEIIKDLEGIDRIVKAVL